MCLSEDIWEWDGILCGLAVWFSTGDMRTAVVICLDRAVTAREGMLGLNSGTVSLCGDVTQKAACSPLYTRLPELAGGWVKKACGSNTAAVSVAYEGRSQIPTCGL